MNTTKILTFGLLLILATLGVVAQYVPVDLDQIEIDDIRVYPDGSNTEVRLDLDRNEEFEVELQLIASADVKDVTIRATVDGFEYGVLEPISDVIGPFDFESNITYSRDLKLKLPADVDVDNYKLRLMISDRDSTSKVYEFNLKVDTKRRALRIDDITFSPGRVVIAGQSLLGRVRVENKGQNDEDDVRVSMSIPSLNLEDVKYIEEIDSGDEEEETEEFFLRIPQSTAPGLYDVNVEVKFNRGRDVVSGTTQITVLENPAVKAKEEAAKVVVVQTAPAVEQTQTVTQTDNNKSGIRTALEVILIVLVVLLVIVGLVIVLSRLREE